MARIVSVVLGWLAFQVSTNVVHAATKVACVGDSITQNSGWCAALGSKLGAGYAVSNFGVSGTTLMKAGDSPYWTSNQFTPSHDLSPSIVVILLGTNDSKPQNWSKKANFVTDYEALIDSYTALASKPKVYACLPPPAGSNTYSISGTVVANEVLPLVRQAATNKDVTVIDLFAQFGGKNLDASLFGSTSDQVHPNAKGAQVICDTVYAALNTTAPPGSGGAGSGGSSSFAGTSAAAGRTNTGGSNSMGGGFAIGGNANTGGRSSGAGGTTSGGSSSGVAQSTTGGLIGLGGSASPGGSATTGGQASPDTNTSSGGTGGSTNRGESTSSGLSATSQSTTGGQTTSGSNTTLPPNASGCGCRVTKRSSSSTWVAMLLGAIAFRRRRRAVDLAR